MRQLIINTLSVQTYSHETSRMESYILDFAESLGLSPIYDNGNIYITKGYSETYPCIVSHTDSVHKIIDDKHFTIIANDNYAIGFDMANVCPSGCGGDDKVGIAICLQALLDYDNIKVAFFRDEEVGCLGSYEANLDFFADCRFVLQCDRRGNSDFINDIYGTPLQSKSFKKDVKHILLKHGYTTTSGALTDVYALKQLGLNLSVANISCGYYNPHEDNEVVVFNDVYNCYNLVCDIIKNMTKTYNHKSDVKKKDHYNYGHGGYRSYYDWDDSYEVRGNKYVCEYCTNVVDKDNLSYSYEYREYLCKDCAEYFELGGETKLIN